MAISDPCSPSRRKTEVPYILHAPCIVHAESRDRRAFSFDRSRGGRQLLSLFEVDMSFFTYITLLYLSALPMFVSSYYMGCENAAGTSPMVQDCYAALSTIPQTEQLVTVRRDSPSAIDAGKFRNESSLTLFSGIYTWLPSSTRSSH